MNLYRRIALLCVFQSLTLHAANDPEKREMRLSGSYADSVADTSEWTVVSATVTYTITEGGTDTNSSTIQGHFSASPEAIVAFSHETGISYSRCQSAVLNYEWVFKQSQPGERAGFDSIYGFATRHIDPLWLFSSWVIGPPPTDKPQGNPKITELQIPGTPLQKCKTTTTKYAWYLEWIEVRNQ
jgi:hypothetical protein